MKKLNKKGFTLVELLAVVVILAILGAIAVTSVTNIIKDNRSKALASSINAVLDAAELACMNETDGVTSTTLPKYLKSNSVTATPGTTASDGTVVITLTKSGEFANVSWPAAGDSKLKMGAATYAVSGSNATITYVCKQ